MEVIERVYDSKRFFTTDTIHMSEIIKIAAGAMKGYLAGTMES